MNGESTAFSSACTVPREMFHSSCLGDCDLATRAWSFSGTAVVVGKVHPPNVRLVDMANAVPLSENELCLRETMV